jgi:glutaredoxin
MLILYTKNNCQYCQKVKQSFLENNITYEERNIENEDYLEEVKGHGAHTMPFLLDTTANVKLNDSADIIDYVQEYSF